MHDEKQAQIDRMIMLYKSGRTTGEVAREVLVSRQTVVRYLKLFGIHDASFNPMRGRTAAIGLESDIARLYTDGLSSCEISLHYGISESTILRALRRSNVSIRRHKNEIYCANKR